jgi:hypothetical protein
MTSATRRLGEAAASASSSSAATAATAAASTACEGACAIKKHRECGHRCHD